MVAITFRTLLSTVDLGLQIENMFVDLGLTQLGALAFSL